MQGSPSPSFWLSFVVGLVAAGAGCGGSTSSSITGLPAGPDSTFGTAGVLAIPPVEQEVGLDVAELVDGRLIIVGGRDAPTRSDWLVRVLEPSGTPSTAFTGDGVEVYPITAGSAGAKAVEIQSDGNIVIGGQAAGAADRDFVIQRLGSSGVNDPLFNGGVPRVIDFGGEDELGAVLVQPDGFIVGVGTSVGRIAAVRLRPDGSLDATFGTGGLATIPLGAPARISSAGIQSTGALVLAGELDRGPTTLEAAIIVRLTPGGALDTSFLGTGFREIDLSAFTETFNDMLVRADDSIVAVGEAGGGTSVDLLIVGLTADGRGIISFGGNGIVTRDLGMSEDVRAIAEQADGNLVLTCLQSPTFDLSDFVTLRLKPDGNFDPGFLGTGALTTDFGLNDFPLGSVVLADGRLVEVGFTATALIPLTGARILVTRTVLD